MEEKLTLKFLKISEIHKNRLFYDKLLQKKVERTVQVGFCIVKK